MSYSVEYFDKVVLNHSLFQFDPERYRLVDLEQEGNFLKYNQMKSDGIQLQFIYDERKRCIHQGNLPAEGERGHLSKIVLPIGVARLEHEQELKVYDQINKVSSYHGYGFQKLGELYVNRMLGIKPKIELPGKTYYLHTDSNMLGSTLTSGHLALSDLTFKEDKFGRMLEGFYSEEQQKFIKFDPNNQAALLGAYLVQLPELRVLDCIGVALKEGKKEYYYLNDYSILPSFKAPVTQLKRTSSLELTSILNSIDLDWMTPPRMKKGLGI